MIAATVERPRLARCARLPLVCGGHLETETPDDLAVHGGELARATVGNTDVVLNVDIDTAEDDNVEFSFDASFSAVSSDAVDRIAEFRGMLNTFEAAIRSHPTAASMRAKRCTNADVVAVERGDGYAARCENCGDITFGGFRRRSDARAAIVHLLGADSLSDAS